MHFENLDCGLNFVLPVHFLIIGPPFSSTFFLKTYGLHEYGKVNDRVSPSTWHSKMKLYSHESACIYINATDFFLFQNILFSL